jgi:hypothetical protein
MEMSAIKICQNSDGILEIEIRPGKQNEVFWVLWTLGGGAILLYLLYQLGIPTLKILPLWAIPFVFFVIIAISGWNARVWYSRGFEKIRVSPEFFSYERRGSFFDCKEKEIPTSEIRDILIYYRGIGDNFIRNRLCVSSTQGRLRIGRELSDSDAAELKRLLQPFVADPR